MPDHGLTWGVLPPDTFERVLVFSPHFDDAAMGAGHLLLAHPGSTVCTVFAGVPDHYPAEVTEWDALGRVRERRRRRRRPSRGGPRRARSARRPPPLARLRRPSVPRAGRSCRPPTTSRPRSRRRSTRSRPTAVVLPLGIANPDHVVTHDAGVQVAQPAPRPRVVRLRGRRLQAHPGDDGVAGVEAVPLRPLADAHDRAHEPGSRPEARVHRVLRVAARATACRPRARRADRRRSGRAVLAARAPAPGLGADARRVTTC